MAEPQIDSFFMQPSGVTTTAPVGAPAPAAQPAPVGGFPPSAPPAAQPAAVPPPAIPPAYQPVAPFYPQAPAPALAPAPVPQPVDQVPGVTPPQIPTPQPAVAPLPQPTQQQVSDALQAAQQLGIDVGRFKDGADLVNTMWATVQAMNQEIEQQRAQYQQMLAQQTPSIPTPAAPQQPEGFKWDMPQYDPAWDMYPDDPTMQSRKREYQQSRNKTADRVLSQFPDLVKQVVGPELAQARQQMQEQIKAEIAQYRYDQQVEAMEAELSPHLYQSDLFGRRTLTPWGEKITNTVRAYVEQGVQDPLWVMKQAQAIVGPPPGGAQQPVQAPNPVAAASAGLPAQAPGAPTAGPPQPQPGGFIPGTQYQVVPVTSIQLRGPDGRIVSPAQLSEQQKQAFLSQAAAARATHVPQVGTTPADIQSRPVTEADLANWFLPQAG